MVTAPAFAQDCFTQTHSDEVEAVLQQADVAWASAAQDDFRAAVQEAEAFVLPCLVEALRPEVAAHLHRVQALVAFLDREREIAASAMRAARAIDADHPIDDAVLPVGHELRTAYDADPVPAVTQRLPRPKVGALWFDGTETNARPTDRPTVAQVQQPNGSFVSAWLKPTDPMLSYPTTPRLRTGLAIGAGVATAAFAGLLGGAYATNGAYYDTDPSDGAKLDRLRSTTNGLAGASIGVGLAGVGLAVGAIAIGPR